VSYQPPPPTRLGKAASRYIAERKTATWKPLLRKHLVLGRPPVLMLVQDLLVRIEPEPWRTANAQTTAVNLIVPEGTLIPWSTPPPQRRAQLVLARFWKSHPRQVMRWVEQLLDVDSEV
jgi:hypothetical protein